MATRPIYLVKEASPYFVEWNVEFDYNSGFATSQKRKNIRAIHEKFGSLFPDKEVLEISSKSTLDAGIKLSAFNMKKFVPSLGKSVSVENIYQAGKVFENGVNYEDLYHVSAKDAKRDERLKNSGKIVGFRYEGRDIPSEPQNLFYDYIYINALLENEDLMKEAIKYDGFTDIEFNPKKSINCQARAAAVFASLYRMGIIDKVRDFDEFYRLMTNNFTAAPSQNPPAVEEATSEVKKEIKEGFTIIHKAYGKGIVSSVNGGIITAHFDSVGEKNLSKVWVENYCKYFAE